MCDIASEKKELFMTSAISSHKKTVRLVTSAIMLALATVLSLIKPVKMPLGGSITLLSMLPICIVSIKYGVGWGLGTAFAYSLVQLAFDFSAALSWGLTKQAVVACFLIDYVLAFTSLGISGIFRKKGHAGVCLGIALAIFLRFVCHVISGGVIFDIWCEWDNAWVYSIAYNGAFMLPEMILTVVAGYFILKLPQMKSAIASD